MAIEKLDRTKAYQTIDDPLKGSTVLPGKWVFDIKCDKEDYITEFRARWRPGFDFDDTYVPVARPESIRLFLSMIDYTTAYLNALIDERCVFMRLPTGYETPGKVCMIN
ncbi:hypothetical protein N7516_008806 [Penicillium verrucosum]|uniref:uncharacterized protein n=1 Tax=Penicillium verrucosum TaxID=60171 RepID=UPI002544D946|nr:uncharacterized protein N7516_008806 [Penicillium verrucosum]KAJ5927033.1 hypothetical protein N7516_008806 [Penicillium verrucosum]